MVKESVGMETLTAQESKRALLKTRCLQRSSAKGMQDVLGLSALIKQPGTLPGCTVMI